MKIRVPEHMTAEISDDGEQLRYAFSALEMYKALKIERVTAKVLAELRFTNPPAFYLVAAYRAYWALLSREQLASKHSDGFHWVFVNDLLGAIPQQVMELSS